MPRLVPMILVLLCSVAPLSAQTLDSAAGPVRVEKVLGGLGTPWGFDFLPGGGFLVTERDGRLLHVANGAAQEVSGVPRVATAGQGGLLDVMVPRDFAQSREVFLTFARRDRGGTHTALASGRLSDDGRRLTGTRILFQAGPPASGGRHFGSRVVEAPDGKHFITIGERGDRPSA